LDRPVHGSRRPAWSARARVGLVEMARTTPGRLALLVVTVVTLWLVTAAIAALTDVASSYGMALWSGLRHLFDPGSLGDDNTTAQRIVGVLQVFTGLVFLVGVAITVLADGVDRGLQRLSEAEPPVTGAGHVLIVGAGHVRSALLAALDREPSDPPVGTVVALSAPGDDPPRPGRHPYKLMARTGDPRDPAALRSAGADSARAIVIVGHDAADPAVADLAALEIAATLTEVLGDDAAPLVAVRAEHSANVEAVWPLLPPTFDAVPADRNVGAVLALAVGLAQYPSLLAAPIQGGGVHVTAPGALAGLPFSEAQAGCPQALPVGLLRSGTATFAPDPGEPIRSDDGLIVLAGDRASADARCAPEAPPAAAAMPTAPASVAAGAVLVLGWSPAGDDLVSELADASHLTVLAQLDAAPSGLAEGALRAGDPNDAAQIAALAAEVNPQIVILLGGANGATDGIGAHARAALGALKVSRIVDRPDVTIVVEQYGSEQADRLRAADPRIRVISRAELVGQALLLSAVDRDALIAQQALVNDRQLALTAVTYTGDDPVALPEAYQGLLAQHSVVLSLARDGRELTLADPAAWVIQPGDGLLLLTRSG
jgi:Trk K+ transport system NAD-binding subunit